MKIKYFLRGIFKVEDMLYSEPDLPTSLLNVVKTTESLQNWNRSSLLSGYEHLQLVQRMHGKSHKHLQIYFQCPLLGTRGTTHISYT